MEVTRQLRTDQLTKSGLAQIQLTYCWDAQRLRTGSGQKVDPKDWDAKRERVRPKSDSYAEAINTSLDRYEQAARALYQEGLRSGRPLLKAEAKARIQHRYDELLAAEVGLPPVPALELAAPPVARPTFGAYFEKWLDEQAHTVNRRTGRPLSATYLTSLRNTLAVLEAYAAHAGQPLRLSGIDRAFYVGFQRYFLEVRAQDLNTFGKHIRGLKNFLGWAEEHDLPGLSGKFHRFEAPEIYRGADALTQDELLRLAAVDFHAPAARASVTAYLTTSFAPTPAAAGQARRKGQRASQVDERRISERLRVLELVRDKLLLCAYTALRISDADRLAPRHVQGDFIRLSQGKTFHQALIPFFDDDVFKPVALLAKYAPLRGETFLPVVHNLNEYLPQVAALAGITRVHVTSKIGRKTFATLKIYQGLPKAQVMLATGHKTESSFNRYLGIDEQELLRSFKKTARTVAKNSGTGAQHVA